MPVAACAEYDHGAERRNSFEGFAPQTVGHASASRAAGEHIWCEPMANRL
jgi:hypothetical protein